MFKFSKRLFSCVFALTVVSVSAKTAINRPSYVPMVPLSPFVQSILNESLPLIKDEENLMVALYGLSAPINRQPLDYAQEKLTQNRLNFELYQKGKILERLVASSTENKLVWQGDFLQLCNLGVEKCFDLVAKQKPIFDALTQKNSVIFERYQHLVTSSKAYVFNAPFYISDDWPAYGLATSSSKLNLFNIANQLISTDIAVRLSGLQQLDQHMSIWLMMAKSKHAILIDKMVAFAMIHRYLHVIAEFLERSPSLTQVEFDRLQSIMKRTLSMDVWDMTAVFRNEFKFFANSQLPLRSQYARLFFSDQSALSDKERELIELLFSSKSEILSQHKTHTCLKRNVIDSQVWADRYFDVNELINYYGDILSVRLLALASDATQQKQQFLLQPKPFPNQKLIDVAIQKIKKNPCAFLKNRQTINIVGQLLAKHFFKNGNDNLFVYIERSRDQEAFAKLVYALLMIRKEQIPIDQVNDFLSLHRSDYVHPISQKPIEFDSVNKMLIADTVTQHPAQQYRFQVEWR